MFLGYLRRGAACRNRPRSLHRSRKECITLRRLTVEPLEDRRMLGGLSFAAPIVPSATADFTQFEVGHFNTSGTYPDIVGSFEKLNEPPYSFTIVSCLANGPASYGNPNYFIDPDYGMWNSSDGKAVQAADFNGDGNLDVSFVFRPFNGSIKVDILLGDGAGNFSFKQIFTLSGISGYDAGNHITGDFSGDGKPDLLIPVPNDAGDPVVYLYTGVGDGTFSGPTTIIYGTDAQGLVTGDFNGDGKLDLATLGQDLCIWRGDGAGHLTLNQQFSVPAGEALASGDLNGDGRTDLVTVDSNGTTANVLLGRLDGTFSDPTSSTTGLSIWSVDVAVVADFDGDGNQDIAFNAGAFTSVAIMVGDGSGNLEASVRFYGGSDNLEVADVNNDGKPDLLQRDILHGIVIQVNQSTPRITTTSTLVSSQNPAVFGQPITFTATMTAASGTPAGTVTFKDGGTLLGTGTLIGDTASFTTSSLALGSHSITATYDGNADFASSTSNTLGETVNKASTTTTITMAPNPAMVGQSVTFTATVGVASPGAGTPTGSVTFKDGATTLSTVALTGDTAAYSTSPLALGSYTITAVYGGDANFLTDSDQKTLLVKPFNHAPVLTPAGSSKTTLPQTATVFALADVINNGAGTTVIQDADAGDPLGSIAVVGATGQGAWAYTLDGSTFHDISSTLTASAALLLPAGASLRYTPDGVNAEIATLTFRAWDTFSGNAGDTGVDTTVNGGSTGFSTATDTLAIRVVRTLTATAPANIGVFNDGYWYRDINGNATWDQTDGNAVTTFGEQGAIPISGDWNGDGTTEVGAYKDGSWWLDTSGNGVFDSDDSQFTFGWAGDTVVPVVGDWNGDGKTDVGIYCQGAWFRDINGNRTWDATDVAALAYLGWAADTQTVIPAPGDWNGDGTTEMGVYCKGVWFRDTAGSGQWDGGYTYWGWNAALTPVAGDWNGDDKDELGVYTQGVWFRDADNSHSWNATNQQALAYYGWSGASPVVGDWTGNAFVYMGFFSTPQMVSYTDSSGAATETLAYSGEVEVLVSPQMPVAEFTSLVWDNDGTVMGQIPSLGYYLVGVLPDSEAAFTTAAYAHANVYLAIPNQVVDFATDTNPSDATTVVSITTASPPLDMNLSDLLDAAGRPLTGGVPGAQVATNAFNYIIDDNVTLSIPTDIGGWRTHGASVKYVGTGGTLGNGLLINVVDTQGKLSNVRNSAALGAAVNYLKSHPSARATINLSQGAADHWTDSANVTHYPTVQQYLPAQQNFLRYWALELANINNADVLKRITLVVSAGNGYIGLDGERHGVNLGQFLSDLHTEPQFSTVFPVDGAYSMLVVGGTEPNGTTVHTAYNYVDPSKETDANGWPTMVYAPGVDVQVAADGTDASGTSFASPAVKWLLDQALAARPTASRDDIVSAYLAAFKALGNHAQPTLQNVWDQLNPIISIDNEMVNEGSGGGTTATGLFVTLSHATDQDVTFTYEERDSSAVDDTDYVKTGPKPITIPAGQTAKAIPLSVIADNIHEPDRTFYVDLTDVDPTAVNLPSSDLSGWVTIIDDDVLHALSVGDVTVTEPESGSTLATFVVQLSPAFPADGSTVTFYYYTVNGSATSGQDYTGITTPQSGWIAAGSDRASISVPVLSDTVFESDQTFRLYVTSVVNATPSGNVDATGLYATGTIKNRLVVGPYQLAVVEIVGSGSFSSRVWDSTGQIDTDQGKYVGTYSGANAGSHWLQTSDIFSEIYNANTGQLITEGTLFFDSSNIASGLSVRIVYPSWLQLEEPSDQLPSGTVDTLSQDALAPIVAAGVARWQAAGLSVQNVSRLARLDVQIADLPGTSLGVVGENVIRIDQDAAGYGWFVDPTPADDLEYDDLIGPHVLAARKGTAADQRVDLLTTVMHEIGHLLGYGHSDSFGLMYPTLSLGERRLLVDNEDCSLTGADDHRWNTLLTDTDVLDQVFASLEDDGKRNWSMV